MEMKYKVDKINKNTLHFSPKHYYIIDMEHR